MNFFNSFFKKTAPFNFKSAAASVFNLDIPSSDSMSAAISLWTDMYQNNSPWLSESTRSLNIAAGVSSEFARLATIDMVSQISGSERADYLNGIYHQSPQQNQLCCNLFSLKT